MPRKIHQRMLPQIHPPLQPFVLDIGCCGTSAVGIAAPGYNLPGFDGASFDLVPEQANVLIVAGRVSRSLAPLVLTLVESLAYPRCVIAYGVCAISGAVFDTVPLSEICPVDLCVPGCPPSTEALRQALAHLSGRGVR